LYSDIWNNKILLSVVRTTFVMIVFFFLFFFQIRCYNNTREFVILHAVGTQYPKQRVSCNAPIIHLMLLTPTNNTWKIKTDFAPWAQVYTSNTYSSRQIINIIDVFLRLLLVRTLNFLHAFTLDWFFGRSFSNSENKAVSEICLGNPKLFFDA